MKMKYLWALMLCLLRFSAYAQTVGTDRTVNWQLSGMRDSLPASSRFINFAENGGKGDGNTPNDAAFSKIAASLQGQAAVIYFPKGQYYFTKPLVLASNMTLKGLSSDSTTLVFKLSTADHLIKLEGSSSGVQSRISGGAGKGSTTLLLGNAQPFSAGDYIRLVENDSSLITSSWALHYTGQIVKIEHIDGNKITLASPLRRSYSVNLGAKVVKMNMAQHCCIEYLKIQRQDATTTQTSNIDMNYAANCRIKCIESHECNFAHIELDNCTNIEISGCYIHHAFAYGGNGQGYGVAMQYATGECRIENNNFNHMRHAILLQAGANGNVCAYNYAVNSYWDESSLPSNSAGDIVLHGNYPYANLFEGNVVQNIVIDNSHGKNGPYNTFFRNRAMLYGIVMNTNAGDSMSFIGSEITNTGFLLGNYAITGNGHYQYGNNIHGSVKPAGTGAPAQASLFLLGTPVAYTTANAWPPIGLPAAINAHTIQVEDLYNKSTFVFCNEKPAAQPVDTSHVNPVDTTHQSTTDTTHSSTTDTTHHSTTDTSASHSGIAPVTDANSQLNVYPNPTTGTITIQAGSEMVKEAILYSINGSEMMHIYSINVMDMGSLPDGMYILRISLSNGQTALKKLVKQR